MQDKIGNHLSTPVSFFGFNFTDDFIEIKPAKFFVFFAVHRKYSVMAIAENRGQLFSIGSFQTGCYVPP